MQQTIDKNQNFSQASIKTASKIEAIDLVKKFWGSFDQNILRYISDDKDFLDALTSRMYDLRTSVKGDNTVLIQSNKPDSKNNRLEKEALDWIISEEGTNLELN